jgi:hypothetical protein
MAGLSLQCAACKAQFRSVEEAQEHAELTKHADFQESTEPVLNLVCVTCGKPCRTQTEKDLHTKRTLHTEFSDTAEAAKPIVLESPNVGASTSGNVSEANPARKCSTYRVCCNGKEASWEYLSKLRIAVVSHLCLATQHTF